MSIHDHPRLALGMLVAVFLAALGIAMLAAPFFNVPVAPALSAPTCANSNFGVTCVGYVQAPSSPGTFSYQMVLSNSSNANCGPSHIAYFVVTNDTSGQSYVVYANNACLFNQ